MLSTLFYNSVMFFIDFFHNIRVPCNQKGGYDVDKLNERIGYIIEHLGMTKTAFAEHLNVSQAFVSQLCSGVKQPSERTLLDICREFKINYLWLTEEKGDMFTATPESVLMNLQKILTLMT